MNSTAHPSAPSASNAPDSSSAPGAPRAFKVFIAEDSPLMQPRIVALALQVEGAVICGVVEVAAGLPQAVDACAPDAVIIDINLRDGNALPGLARAKREHPGMLALVCSSSATSPYRHAALAAGADQFIDKSLECERIPEILDAWRRASQAASMTDHH